MINEITSNFWLYISLVAILGLLVGSFLNVVIHRLPIMIKQRWREECLETLAEEANEEIEQEKRRFSLAFPPSHCPECLVRLSVWHNIPIFSYVLLGGRCAHCKARIPFRYLLVELVCLLFSVIAAVQFGFSIELLFMLLLTWLLIPMTFIDFEHQIIPDGLTFTLLWLGLLSSCFNLFATTHDAILGAIFGYLFYWIVNAVFKLLTRRDGIGQGDFKLLAAAGAWLGWQLLPFVILTSSFIALIYGIFMMSFFNHERRQPIPFGPFIAIALWLGMIWGFDFTQNYLHLFGITWSNV